MKEEENSMSSKNGREKNYRDERKQNLPRATLMVKSSVSSAILPNLPNVKPVVKPFRNHQVGHSMN
jgi:hypothetical protein